jgi:hypothetical protein
MSEQTTLVEKPLEDIRDEAFHRFRTTGSPNLDLADDAVAMFDHIWNDLTIGNYVDCIRKYPVGGFPKDMWTDSNFVGFAHASLRRWSKIARAIGGGSPTANQVWLAAYAVVHDTNGGDCDDGKIPRCTKPKEARGADGSGIAVQPSIRKLACEPFSAEFKFLL